MTNEEVKPCPFCGGQAYLYYDYSSETGETRWNVWHACDGPVGKSQGYGSACVPWFETPWYLDRDKAIGAWNRRDGVSE